jgi:hypothetical protein
MQKSLDSSDIFSKSKRACVKIVIKDKAFLM